MTLCESSVVPVSGFVGNEWWWWWCTGLWWWWSFLSFSKVMFKDKLRYFLQELSNVCPSLVTEFFTLFNLNWFLDFDCYSNTWTTFIQQSICLLINSFLQSLVPLYPCKTMCLYFVYVIHAFLLETPKLSTFYVRHDTKIQKIKRYHEYLIVLSFYRSTVPVLLLYRQFAVVTMNV